MDVFWVSTYTLFFKFCAWVKFYNNKHILVGMPKHFYSKLFLPQHLYTCSTYCALYISHGADMENCVAVFQLVQLQMSPKNLTMMPKLLMKLLRGDLVDLQPPVNQHRWLRSPLYLQGNSNNYHQVSLLRNFGWWSFQLWLTIWRSGGALCGF